MIAPCKDCPDRHVDDRSNCHTTCERYQRYHEQKTRSNERRQDDKVMSDYIAFCTASKRESKLRSKGRRGY